MPFFSVSAVIPTQQYGNIQPKVEVTAGSIEEARDAAMNIIEDLYRKYAELPLNGREPRFYGKVSEEVKVVVPPKEEKPAPEPKPAPETREATAAVAKPDPVLKAESAIAAASSPEAILLVGRQIEASTKIPAEYKDDLATLVLKKRNALAAGK